MNVLHTFKAVLWAFFGVRKRSGYEEDLGKLSPLSVVGVALVNWVLASGVAQ